MIAQEKQIQSQNNKIDHQREGIEGLQKENEVLKSLLAGIEKLEEKLKL